MLQAFFDESGHPESGLFCVAGYGMMSHQVRRFDREWKRLLGTRTLHMKELAHLRGDFAGMTREAADTLLKEAVEIINRRVAFGVVVFCHVENIEKALEGRLAKAYGFENLYSICHYACMLGVGQWSHQHNAGTADYVFEDGPRRGAVTQALIEMKKSPEMVELCALGLHAFTAKREFLALQAADLLAWEWIKAQREPERALRRSMEELVSCHRVKYLAYYLGQSSTSKFLDHVERIAIDSVLEKFERAQERERRSQRPSHGNLDR